MCSRTTKEWKKKHCSLLYFCLSNAFVMLRKLYGSNKNDFHGNCIPLTLVAYKRCVKKNIWGAKEKNEKANIKRNNKNHFIICFRHFFAVSFIHSFVVSFVDPSTFVYISVDTFVVTAGECDSNMNLSNIFVLLHNQES